MKKSEVARVVAQHLHGKQKYGKRPYVEHLDAVVAVLRRFGVHDEDTIVTAYLHDVLEDTEAGEFLADDLFGPCVGRAVRSLTRRPEVSAQEYWNNILDDELALPVKLADRVANVEALIGSPTVLKRKRGNKLLDRYRIELVDVWVPTTANLDVWPPTACVNMLTHARVLLG